MGNSLICKECIVHTLNERVSSISVDESGLLNVVETVRSLNNSVDERVESGHVGNMSSNSGGTSSTSRGGTEELSSVSVVRVVEESVLVVSVGSGGILTEELSVPVSVLNAVTTVNVGNLDVDSESVSGESVGSVEEISERGDGHGGEFGGDFGDNDGVRHVGAGKVGSVGVGVVGNLSEGTGGLGSVDESADVGVVRLSEDVLVSSAVSGDGSDVDGLSSSEVGELELGAESVPGFTGVVSKSDFVGVFIELVDLSDLTVDIKVFTGSDGGGLVKGSDGGNGSGGGHVSGSPLAEGGEDVAFGFLERGSLVRVAHGLVSGAVLVESGLLVGREESPRSGEVGVEVELTSVVIDSHGGSVNSDDISESVDNWEVFESVGEDDEVSPLVLLSGAVEGSVNDLEGAYESVLGDLVGEGSINDDTVDVVGLSTDDGSVSE